MNNNYLGAAFLLCISYCLATTVIAEPITYQFDPSHTYPAFEADHFHGLSIWRGKVNSTSGTVTWDKEAQAGSLEVTMEMASIDFGHEGMNRTAHEEILEVAEFPTATYVGTLVNFVDGQPTGAEGMLTLHGVTLPLNLTINRFQCQPHPRSGLEICGSDSSATFNRADYGLDADLHLGFFPEVRLLISAEARAPRED